MTFVESFCVFFVLYIYDTSRLYILFLYFALYCRVWKALWFTLSVVKGCVNS